MSTLQTSRIFRVFSVLAVLVLALSQFVGLAQAEGPQPPQAPTKEPLNLNEVQAYYGRLADLQGVRGVIVELEDTPSALVYADKLNQSADLAVQSAVAQTARIQQKQSTLMAALQSKAIKYTELYRVQKVYNGIALKLDTKDIPALLKLPGVKAIHPLIPKTIDHTTSVPLIGAPQVWGGLPGILGENITVGVIDTGIDYIHTNFGGLGTPGYATQDFTTLNEPLNVFPTAKVVGGWDFAGDAYSAGVVDIPSPDPDPMDCNGHGSHVSGTVGGFGVLPDGSTYQETTGDTYSTLGSLTPTQYMAKFRIGPGVAPKAQLYGLRVFGCEGSTNLVLQAIEWSLDPNNDGNFSDHLDVINMSLGSSYGSPYDEDAVASNNAAQVGVIVVTSAGNSGDVYYVAGSPGMAKYTVDVASSIDAGGVVGAFVVNAPVGIAGNYAGVEAAFGPVIGVPGTTGDLILTIPAANGCTAAGGITNDLTGKIALIDRGACTFKEKVKNAQLKGAIGVLVANNTVGFPTSMGDDPLTTGTITIPSMMTTQTVGNMLKTQMAVPFTVTVRLTDEFSNQYLLTDPAIEDLVSSFSSRGPARGGTLLKPDIAAPGDTIFSTASRSGDQGASFNGTSMAAPHVAGVMALLRQLHPSWSVAELKALAMNTATNDVYSSTTKALKDTPTRIGAGRVSVAKAAQSDVVAYYTNDPGQVSLSFGEVALVSDQTFVKDITIKNKSNSAEIYNVTFDSRYQANPGLVFSLLDSAGAALVSPLSVPAQGSVSIKVQIAATASLLNRGRDATIVTNPTRERFAEAGGYVTLTSTGVAATVRVPVHIAARPASAMSVVPSGILLPAASTGTFALTSIGIPVATALESSRAYVTELLDVSPNDPASNGSNDAADLQYVGAASDYTSGVLTDASMYFSIATYGKWDTLHAPEYDIYIDNNEDGTPDYVIFNNHTGSSSSPTDTFLSMVCLLSTGSCYFEDYINWFGGATNTNVFNNNVMTMDVLLEDIGLTSTDTGFDFQVFTFNREAAGLVDVSKMMHFDVANQSFSANNAGISGIPVWLDDPAAPAITVAYDKANIAANHSKGLLILHTHNAANTAQVLLLPPSVSSITAADPNPTNSASVDFTVTFSSLVTGVDVSDFALTKTGVSGANITSVVGAGDTYTVKVNTGTTSGTIRLDLLDNDSIMDASSNRLGGMGTGNGDFITGDVYSVFRPATFADVPPTYWAWGWIERLNAAGITSGCSTSPMLYCPEVTVTRTQVAIFLLRGIHGAAYNPPPAVGNIFSDVKAGDFGAAWIEQLYTEGITSGCGDTRFCPNDEVTRAQMAVFLLRVKHGSAYTPPAATGTLFTDVSASSFAAGWIEQLSNEGITSGCGGGKFCPGLNVTRAQMAVFLVRIFALP